jgi:hypothetical protein
MVKYGFVQYIENGKSREINMDGLGLIYVIDTFKWSRPG